MQLTALLSFCGTDISIRLPPFCLRVEPLPRYMKQYTYSGTAEHDAVHSAEEVFISQKPLRPACHIIFREVGYGLKGMYR
jgi:hypothetical protein